MNADLIAWSRARRTRDPRFDGRFWIGVVTTKIYCRPICPAPSPKEENVRYFQSAAAAAEAGFRPCLRCRPEASPGTPAWSGASTTVSRALRLISESALDDGGVDDLAERLGIGSRHLRRLFLLHLGATPVSVAQTRRLHFAKRLIDETSLSFSEVALASGFGSVRRFNSAFMSVYGRTPTAIRALNRKTPGSPPGHYRLRLPYRSPYDVDGILSFLALRAIPGVEHVEERCYRRTISLDGQPGRIEVRFLENKSIEAAIVFPHPAALFRIAERIRRIFDLGADPQAIAAQLGRDPFIAERLRARPGARVPGAWDGWELGVRAILGQQVSVRAATTLAGRLVREFGTVYDGGSGSLTHLFPQPDAVCGAPVERIGLPARRAESIRAFAKTVCSGEIHFDGAADPDRFARLLCGIPGVGPWTAQYMALRALSEPDAFPAGDLGLLRSTGARTEAELLKRAEKWRPWRAYAVMLLWGGER